jgi:hypothetical protein
MEISFFFYDAYMKPGTLTRYRDVPRTRQPRFCGSTLTKAHTLAEGVQEAFYLTGTGSSSSGSKGTIAWSRPLSNQCRRHEWWRYTPISPYVFMPWKLNNNSMALVRERTISNELPPRVGEVPFFFRIEGVVWSAQQIPMTIISIFLTYFKIYIWNNFKKVKLSP